MPKLLTSESPRINCWMKFSHADTDLQTVELLNAERCLPRDEWFPHRELVLDYRSDTRHFTGCKYEDALFFPPPANFSLPSWGFCLFITHFHFFLPILVKKKPVLEQSVLWCCALRATDEPRGDEEKETLKRRKGRFVTSAWKTVTSSLVLRT